MAKDNPIYDKIKPKGDCWGYFRAIILPVRERDIILNMPGKRDLCHPVMRVIFHSVLQHFNHIMCLPRVLNHYEEDELK